MFDTTHSRHNDRRLHGGRYRLLGAATVTAFLLLLPLMTPIGSQLDGETPPPPAACTVDSITARLHVAAAPVVSHCENP